MTIAKKKNINILLVFTLLLSLFTPSFTLAKEIEGDVNNPSLTIHKFEQEPGTEAGEEGTGLPGQDTNGKPVEEVEFTLTLKETFNPETDEWSPATEEKTIKGTTDQNGQIVFTKDQDLELGRYEVQETAGPDHIVLNPQVFTVDIPMTNSEGTELNYNVHIYPKNETIRGTVDLTKTDGDSADKLQGVQFELYHADGTKVEDTTTFTTDENGKIIVDNLAYGDYYFKEIATKDGYVLGSQKVEFSIETSGATVEVDIKNYKEPDAKKEVDESAVNRGEVVTYTISIDLPGDINEYKNFVVTDNLHENLEFVEVVSQPEGFTFNQDGQTLTWTATPSELSGPSTVEFTFKAKVSEDAEANVGIDNKANIDYENKHGSDGQKETDPTTVTPTAGSLKVIKQDKSTKDRLEGAEFELRDANGNVVETGTTDNNGELVFTTELDYGEYTLHETKAPNDYRKLTKPIDVEIDQDNQNVTLTVDNSKSAWELPTTGGIGTVLFTAIGIALMGIALFAYLRRRNTVEQ